MPASRRTPSKAKAPKPKPKSNPSSGTVNMSASQKATYDKLKKRGMSDNQARAFSAHASARKEASSTNSKASAKKKPAARKATAKKK